MPKIVSTPHGDITLLEPSIELLQAVRRFMPFGAARYAPPREGADFGIVMQCGECEMMALNQLAPPLDEREGVLAYQANSLLIAHALAGYVKRGCAGLLMPCAYMRKTDNGKLEAGIAYFGTPDPEGTECLDQRFDPSFDNEFGHGFTYMVGSLIGCLQDSAAAIDIPLFPIRGFESCPRLQLEVLGFGFMVIGQSILCLKTKISSDDPVWMALLAGGATQVYHLPSIPAGISNADLAITKHAPDQPAETHQASVGRIWPESSFPTNGCRILFHEDTEKPYSMPIRPLSASIEEEVKDHNNPQAWYDFAYNNEALSYSDKIACLQRAVILHPLNSGWWYTLGCHYELEGKDWYGATNAFNHVIYLNPASGVAWFSLSQLWAARGFMSKAQECRARFDSLTSEDRRQ
jgi:hypothetical protein